MRWPTQPSIPLYTKVDWESLVPVLGQKQGCGSRFSVEKTMI